MKIYLHCESATSIHGGKQTSASSCRPMGQHSVVHYHASPPFRVHLICTTFTPVCHLCLNLCQRGKDAWNDTAATYVTVSAGPRTVTRWRTRAVAVARSRNALSSAPQLTDNTCGGALPGPSALSRCVEGSGSFSIDRGVP
ncbi:hypothetical protein BaRGS_00000054 [Batillaria attramentaria]|uniref:Uncharacterized protein n=1 Tax=Batillaria attramentaria TaxID=370345 RepID=A0ABD0MBX3_9CAEN